VLTRLTDAHGYDAEASYSPDGQWIVFSSTRDAYSRVLTDPEQRLLAADPSYFGEIYLMRPYGSQVQRLTETPGYDGGPFFTHDGRRIVWRRFDERGLIADVWTMRSDGSEATQVTGFGAMSPYEYPSGDIRFASNKLESWPEAE
jgi:Tol biopolymer transport system component